MFAQAFNELTNLDLLPPIAAGTSGDDSPVLHLVRVPATDCLTDLYQVLDKHVPVPATVVEVPVQVPVYT